MTELSGAGALVTGGGSGIGLACATGLAAAGAVVTVCGRSEERLRAGVAAISSAVPGARTAWVVADVTEEDSIASAVRAAVETAGNLRAVVAAAGGSSSMGPIGAIPVDAWRSTVDLNVTGTFLTLKHAVPHLAAGGGSFVALSSIAATATHRYMSAYSVAKAAIDMLVRNAADELGPSGIRVNAVRPGLVDTGLVTSITSTPAVLASYLDNMPISRVGRVGDVAAAVLWLLGPESAWVTGTCLAVDGGHALRRGPDYTPFAEPLYGAEALRGALPAG
jgi:NAD(P)-dependent dehydrogenase (short-subunit alcohol dehydrogenase family)